jgi:N12 class adenine-specific DNA methylase
MNKLTYNLLNTAGVDENEAQRLADMYIAKGIIPQKYVTDALHIATATVQKFDFVVSYNLGHIVKLKTIIGAGFVNLREGYKQIGLTTPTEVIEYD